MIYRHTKEQINDYFQAEGINQSLLKVIITSGIQEFIKQRELMLNQDEDLLEDKAHFIIGKAVDCWITQGKEAFDSMYHISKLVKKPSDVEIVIIKTIFQKVAYLSNGDKNLYGNLADYPIYFYEAANTVPNGKDKDGKDKFGYYMNRKKDIVEEDGRLANLLKTGVAELYWQDLIDAIGKQILTDGESTLITTIVNSFLEHKHTSKLFEERKDRDIIYQIPLFFEEAGVLCKILPDVIFINHQTKTITPADFKTTFVNILTFNKQIEIRRYDFQGSFYTNGIKKNRDKISKLIDKDISNYRVDSFGFIVESTTTPGTPVIFVLSKEVLEIGRIGDGRRKLGWLQALDLYKMWVKAEFSIEEMLRDTNGVLWIEGIDFSYNKIL